MENQTIRPLWLSLLTVRSALYDRLIEEHDKEVRKNLFEAHYATGLALLHLERVDFELNADLIETADKPGDNVGERLING